MSGDIAMWVGIWVPIVIGVSTAIILAFLSSRKTDDKKST